MLYAKGWANNPPAGNPDPNNPGWNVEIRVVPKSGRHAVDVCLDQRVLQRVRGCRPPLSGYSASDAYYGTYGLYSCYETLYDNDMATALGISSLNAEFYPCGYVGWYGLSWSGYGPYDGYVGSPDDCGLCVDTFGQLAAGYFPDGYPFDFARNWIFENRPTYLDPNPDGLVRGRGPVIAPFFNWGFWGTNDAELLFY